MYVCIFFTPFPPLISHQGIHPVQHSSMPAFRRKLATVSRAIAARRYYQDDEESVVIREVLCSGLPFHQGCRCFLAHAECMKIWIRKKCLGTAPVRPYYIPPGDARIITQGGREGGIDR